MNHFCLFILIDQWKAAKEELEEDEEEPENAYEILERKREREIKVTIQQNTFDNLIYCICAGFLPMFLMQEWHAQQIASGDAKENANFQPLGGDWYEAQMKKYNSLVLHLPRKLSYSRNPSCTSCLFEFELQPIVQTKLVRVQGLVFGLWF